MVGNTRNKVHDEMNITSDLLNLRLSYYWRPLANNEDLIQTFRKWNTPPYDSTPDYIFTGFL